MKELDVLNGNATRNEDVVKKKRGRKKVIKDAIAIDGMASNSQAARSSSQKDFSLEDAEDPSVCEACLDGTVYEDNEILFCDKCNVAVHQNCYSISSIPEGPWFCDACSFNADPKVLHCELCSNSGGIYKMTEKPGRWVHVLCSFWIPEIFEVVTPQHKAADMPPMHLNMAYLDKKRYKLKCGLCSTKGACIQCCAGRCTIAAHPWCVVKNPRGFTRRIIKNDEGNMVWEVFCKAHAKAVSEPYKPRPKAKQSIAINIGDGSDDQSQNGEPEYWPTTEKVSSSSAKPKSQNQDKQKLWMRHANNAVDNKMLYSASKNKQRLNSSNVEEDDTDEGAAQNIETKEEQVQFPILSFLEWPGQSEGEGMDLDHYWNVISTYFAEDHSKPWLNFMLESFRSPHLNLLTEGDSKSHPSTFGDGDNWRSLMTLPPLGKNLSRSVMLDMIEAADEKLAALGSDKERFSVFDPAKRSHFLSRVDSCIQTLNEKMDGDNSDDDENDYVASSSSSPRPSNKGGVQDGVGKLTLRDDVMDGPDQPLVMSKERSSFTLMEDEYLQQDIIYPENPRSARKSVDDQKIVQSSTVLRVVFDGDNRIGCEFSLKADVDRSLANHDLLLNEQWVSTHVIPVNKNGSDSNTEETTERLAALDLVNTQKLSPEEEIELPDRTILSQDFDDDLCRVIRTSQLALSALTHTLSNRINYTIEKEDLFDRSARTEQVKSKWSVVESLYVKQQIWKHVCNGVKKGFKDQLPDFNRSVEENLPASWTIQVNGRPAPPKDDDDDDIEIHEDAVCMSCFDGSSMDGNKILFCDGCNASVHQICYGVSEIPEGDFFCDRCKYVKILYENEDWSIALAFGNSKASSSTPIERERFQIDGDKVKTVVMCCLCPLFHGAIKPTTDGRWVHLCCAIWAGNYSVIEDLSEMSPIDVSKVPLDQESVLSKPCLYCGMFGGYMERCCHVHDSSDYAFRCEEVFHPICAWFEGAFVTADIVDPTFQGVDKGGAYPSGLRFSFRCERHSSEARGSATVKDEQHTLRSKYRLAEDDLEQIPGSNKRRRHKKKKKPAKDSSGRITASGNVVKELNRDIYDDKICAICFNPMMTNIFNTGKTDSSKTDTINDSNVMDQPIEKFQCCDCKLTVHASCFLGRHRPTTESAATWRCNSCLERTEECPNIKCVLCPRTGGFFQPTTDSNWSHVFCARTAPGIVIILPETHNSTVDIRSIPKEFKKQKCTVCNRKYGTCLRCSHLGCANHYHALCGIRSGKAFMRVRMGEILSFCHEHIPDGIERFRPGYWVDGQELQHLRYSLDRARLIIDILCRRDRCKKLQCKVDAELFTLKFPRILDKAKGRRSNTNSGEVDLSDFSINSSESEYESEQELQESTPAPSANRRGRPKQSIGDSSTAAAAAEIDSDMPEKLDLLTINTPHGDLQISSTWINMRKKEVRLPKNIGVNFSGVDLKKTSSLSDGNKLKVFLKGCKESIAKNVNETRENTRIFADQNTENSFVSSVSNQLMKHLQLDDNQFLQQMAPYRFLKLNLENKSSKKVGKKGYVTIVEPYPVERQRSSGKRVDSSDDDFDEDDSHDKDYDVPRERRKRGRNASKQSEEVVTKETKRLSANPESKTKSRVKDDPSPSMAVSSELSPLSSPQKRKRGRPRYSTPADEPDVSPLAEQTVENIESSIPVSVDDHLKLEEAPSASSKKKKPVKVVEERNDNRYSFRKSLILPQDSVVPEKETNIFELDEHAPPEPPVVVPPPENFVFKNLVALRGKLSEYPPFAAAMLIEGSSEDAFPTTVEKLGLQRYFTQSSLSEWVEYSKESLFLLERQLLDILKVMESSRVDDVSSKPSKKHTARVRKSKSPQGSPLKVAAVGDSQSSKTLETDAAGREIVEEFMEIPYSLLPNYDSLVRRPVTVQTLKSNVVEHQYVTMASFTRDFYFMLNNARSITTRNSKTWADSSRLASIFETAKANVLAESSSLSPRNVVSVSQQRLGEDDPATGSVGNRLCALCQATYKLPDWPSRFCESAKAFLGARADFVSPSAAPPTPTVAAVLSPRSSHSRSSRSGESKDKRSKEDPAASDLFEWICAECVNGKNDLVEQQYLSARQAASSATTSSASSASRTSSDIQEVAEPYNIAALAEASWNHEILDRQVLVWWQDDDCCYRGTVSAYDPISRRHRVLYDDGEWEFIDLAVESVLYVSNRAENADTNRSSNSRSSNNKSSSYRSPAADQPPPQKRTKRL